MKKILGFLAVAGLLFVAAPSGSAQAMPIANPAAAAAGQVADGVTTVDWRRVPTVPYSHRHRYRHDHRWDRHRVHRPPHRHYRRHYHRHYHRH